MKIKQIIGVILFLVTFTCILIGLAILSGFPEFILYLICGALVGAWAYFINWLIKG